VIRPVAQDLGRSSARHRTAKSTRAYQLPAVPRATEVEGSARREQPRLSGEAIEDIIAFLQTLTDGYPSGGGEAASPAGAPDR
jgi:hypothetical protein